MRGLTTRIGFFLLQITVLVFFLGLSNVVSDVRETEGSCQMFDEEYVTCSSQVTHFQATTICREWGGSLVPVKTGDIFLDDAIRDMGSFQIGSDPWWVRSDSGCLLSDGSRSDCDSKHPFVCVLRLFQDPAVCFQDGT